jgi:hypothetical protein
MTTTTETTATRTCPPSAAVDMIVPWPDVQPGELVLWDGELQPVEQNLAWAEDASVRIVKLAGEVSHVIPCGTYAAVRRYTEGISDRDALVIAALDEAAADREYRASTACTDCTYAGDGPCPDQREHAERAAEYRAERDRREAGR